MLKIVSVKLIIVKRICPCSVCQGWLGGGWSKFKETFFGEEGPLRGDLTWLVGLLFVYTKVRVV